MISNKYIKFILLGIFLIALGFRSYQLDFQSLWYEELMTLKFSKGNSFFSFLSSYIKNPDFHPPIYPILIYFIKSIGVDSDMGLRLISVFFGSISVFWVYLLGKRFFNVNTGILASLFFALSAASINYSQEVRYSSFLVFLILLLSESVHDYDENGGNKYSIFKLVLIGIILSYTHYLGFIFSLALMAYFILRNQFYKKNINFYLLIFLSYFVAFIPWLFVLASQIKVWNIYRIYNQQPNLLEYFYLMFKFAFVYENYWFIQDSLVKSIELELIYATIILSVIVFVLFKQKKLVFSNRMVFLLGVILGPIIVFYFHDYFSNKKYFYEKVLLFTLPFIYILLAFFIENISNKKEVYFPIIFIITSLFVFHPLINLNLNNIYYKTEFKQSSYFIKESNQLDAPIVFACGDSNLYDYYFEKFNIKNKRVEYSEEVMSKMISSKRPFWIYYAHCQPSLSMFKILENERISLRFNSHTVADAILYNEK